MNDTTQQLEWQKNNLYRDRYRSATKWLIAMLILCVSLSVILALLSIVKKQPEYFATTTSGIIIPLHSLSEPVITSKYMLQWASLATRAAYNLDFAHYKQQLNKAKPYFTPTGWQKFLTALKSSGVLTEMINQKLVMSAVVYGPAVILNSAVIHGRFTWRIQLPLLVTFTSANHSTRNHLMITMSVSRVPVLNTSAGIQITDFMSE